MRDWKHAAAAISVSCLLSCSLIGPERGPGPASAPPAARDLGPLEACVSCPPPGSEQAPPREAPHYPGPIEWIESRFLAYQTGLSRHEIRRVAETVVAESERHGLDWELVLAVIRIESGYFNFARSSVGALGLMQIMPGTGEELARRLEIPWRGERSLFDPIINVRMGTAYLRELHTQFGRWDRALAAYNWGPGAIGRRLLLGEPVPSLYSTKVLALLEAPRS